MLPTERDARRYRYICHLSRQITFEEWGIYETQPRRLFLPRRHCINKWSRFSRTTVINKHQYLVTVVTRDDGLPRTCYYNNSFWLDFQFILLGELIWALHLSYRCLWMIISNMVRGTKVLFLSFIFFCSVKADVYNFRYKYKKVWH